MLKIKASYASSGAGCGIFFMILGIILIIAGVLLFLPRFNMLYLEIVFWGFMITGVGKIIILLSQIANKDKFVENI